MIVAAHAHKLISRHWIRTFESTTSCIRSSSFLAKSHRATHEDLQVPGSSRRTKYSVVFLCRGWWFDCVTVLFVCLLSHCLWRDPSDRKMAVASASGGSSGGRTRGCRCTSSTTPTALLRFLCSHEQLPGSSGGGSAGVRSPRVSTRSGGSGSRQFSGGIPPGQLARAHRHVQLKCGG